MNAWRAERFNYLDNLAKLGKPVDAQRVVR